MTDPPVDPASESPPRRPLWLPIAFLTVALLVAAAAALWLRQSPVPLPAAPSPAVILPLSGGTPAATASTVTGVFIEPGDGRAPLLDEIAAARTSIDLEVYIVTDDVVLRSLEDAHLRGVAVRVLLEEHPFGGDGGQQEIFARLENAGIAVRWGNPVFRFSHVKTMVVDNAVAVIMNQNITNSAFTTNREFGVVTNRSDAVQTAAAIFEADWTRGTEPPPGPLVVSPTNSRDSLLGLIEGARGSLAVYAEVLRDPELLDALAAAAGRGVRVRLIVSPSADNAADRAELAASGIEIRLASGLYIHAKMIVADGERAFIGSQNLSATSLDQNRELGIILDDPVSLSRLTRTFEIDFRSGLPQETP